MSRIRGIGSVPADVMIVGEAPGPIEAKLGYPFAGPLSKLVLPLVLRMPGKVFLTNAVQRPRFSKGRIRKTTWNDMIDDLSFLQEEIRRVRPRVMVALGKLASEALNALGFRPIVLPHPRFARIRKRAIILWLRLVEETGRKVRKALGR